jgi:hypothetical protein
VDEGPDSTTGVPEISIRLLAPGDEFVLTEPDDEPANALYRCAGGATDSVKVEWTFSYADD